MFRKETGSEKRQLAIGEGGGEEFYNEDRRRQEKETGIKKQGEGKKETWFKETKEETRKGEKRVVVCGRAGWKGDRKGDGQDTGQERRDKKEFRLLKETGEKERQKKGRRQGG